MSSSSLVTGWDSTQRVLLQSWKICLQLLSLYLLSSASHIVENLRGMNRSVCQSLDNTWNVPSNAELSGMLDQLCDGRDTTAESEERSERSYNC